ncbi:hypothetical protein GALL_391100 [mine drainage metagenome]|uniref:Uncharacterized protein n=1 Tax=mine drainage metagenome TaxID=410659 RepID=A0A1J5Q7J6_9ZZZZ
MGKGDFEKQDGGGCIERALGGEKVGSSADFAKQRGQRLGQYFTARGQGLQRLAQPLRQFDQPGHACRIDMRLRVAGQGAPGFAQGLGALACLLDERRIDQAEMALPIIGKWGGTESELLVDGMQQRGGTLCRTRAGMQRLRAEKGQVVPKTLRRRVLAHQLAAQLQVQTVEQAFDVGVEREQAGAKRFEHAARQPPQAGGRPLAAVLGTAGDGVQLTCCGSGLLPAQDVQQRLLVLPPILLLQHVRARFRRSIGPGPVMVPEVGGVDAFGLRQFQQAAVLRIEFERGFILAGALGFEVIDQGIEAGFEAQQGVVAQLLRVIDQAIERGLRRLHQPCRTEKSQ